MDFDFERSEESLREDEEIREAVEELVEAAAVAVYTDIKNDVDSLVLRFRNFMDALFPFLADWRSDETLFWQDLQKCVIWLCFLWMACFVLSPRHNPRKKNKYQFDQHGRRRLPLKGKIQSLLSFRGVRSLSANSLHKAYNLGRSTSTPVRDLTMSRERSHSDASINLTNLGKGAHVNNILDDDNNSIQETEEEKFARIWPSILSETRYHRLVLPPECKLVEKPKHAPPSKEKGSGDEHPSKEDERYYDDHPLNRLLTYWRQFMHLLVTLLRFDYVGAGWTLIYWIQACLKIRKKRGAEEDDDDDDESVASSVRSSTNNNNKRESLSSTAASGHAAVISDTFTPRVRARVRQKRDSALGSTTKPPVSDTDDDYHSVESEMMETASLTDSLTIDPSESIIDDLDTTEEEKKEASSSELGESDARPSTPNSALHAPVTRTTADPPGNYGHLHDSTEGITADKLALKVGSSVHSRSSTGPKTKDALESYRTTSVLTNKPQTVANPSTPKRGRPRGESTSGNSVTSAESDSTDPQTHERSSTFFFEPAESQESLKKMIREVPVPDRHGYILGDEFLPNSNFTPLLVFVNSRSGPQQGHMLISQLRGLLNPIQVWDLIDGGPEPVIESFSVFTRLRILVCGGDGTVSWIVSCIEKMKLSRWPPIAILPLGTGNDLARIHGWGGGYNNESLLMILEQVADSYISWLDRWEMTVENKKGKVKSVQSFFNYLGVGADAQAALQVHMLRESRPQLFFSRMVNKAWYGIFGAEDIIKATSMNLPHEITLIADGVEVPLPHDSQGIILLNIDSYAGGVPLWSKGVKESEMGFEKNSNEMFPLHHLPRRTGMKKARSLRYVVFVFVCLSVKVGRHKPPTHNFCDYLCLRQ